MTLTGHAIECRINAEDPTANSGPAPARWNFSTSPAAPVSGWTPPSITAAPLPLLRFSGAKVMVHAPTRLEAIRRMRRCLEEFTLEGFPTNAELSYELLFHPTLSGAAVPPPFWTEACRSCWNSAAG